MLKGDAILPFIWTYYYHQMVYHQMLKGDAILPFIWTQNINYYENDLNVERRRYPAVHLDFAYDAWERVSKLLKGDAILPFIWTGI